MEIKMSEKINNVSKAEIQFQATLGWLAAAAVSIVALASYA